MSGKHLLVPSFLVIATITTVVASMPVYANEARRPVLMVAGVFDGIGRLFDRKMSHLQELIDTRQYEDAEAFYSANKEALDHSNDIGAALTTLTGKLNERYAGEADDLIARLSGMQFLTSPTLWPDMVGSLKQAQDLIDKYNRFPTLKLPAYRSPKIAQLAEAMDHGATGLLDGAETAFAKYDHAEADFFDKYPVSLPSDRKEKIVDSHLDKWLPLVGKLSQQKAHHLIKTYSPFLHSEKALAALGAAYEKALVGWNGWKEPLEIDKVWSLGGLFQSIGIDPKYVSAKRAVLVLTGPSAGPIPPGWEIDASAYGVPYLIGSVEELDQEIAQLSAKNIHYFVVIDPSRVVRMNTLTHSAPVTGNRTTGTRQDVNPAYTRAKQAVENAQADYNSAVQQKQAASTQLPSTNNSPLSMLSSVAGMLASTSASMSVDAAQNRLNAARSALAATPLNITEDITEPYTYLSAVAHYVVEQQVGIYFVDTKNGFVYRSKIDGIADDSDNIYAKVDARDPQKEELDDKTKKAIDKFQRPSDVSVEPAEKVLPAVLNNPVGGSKRQIVELSAMIGDDEALFLHKNVERLQKAWEETEKTTTALGVDLNISPPAEHVEMVAFTSLPNDISCNELVPVRGSARLLDLWKSALTKVVRLNNDTVQSSYVFMEARDDLSNLREEIARDAHATDTAQGIETALAALKSTAALLNNLLSMPMEPIDKKKSVANLNMYLSERMKSGVYNTVAEKAREARPKIVSGLYVIYHYGYNEKNRIDKVHIGSLFGAMDEKLDQLGKQLSDYDSQLSNMLNTVASTKAAEEVNSTIDTRCDLRPAPAQAPSIVTVPFSPAPAPATPVPAAAPAPVALPATVPVASTSAPVAAQGVAASPVAAPVPVSGPAPAAVTTPPVAATPAVVPEPAKPGQ